MQRGAAHHGRAMPVPRNSGSSHAVLSVFCFRGSRDTVIPKRETFPGFFLLVPLSGFLILGRLGKRAVYDAPSLTNAGVNL